MLRTDSEDRLKDRMSERVAAMTKKVLFVCRGNSARSQMAEALLRNVGRDAFDVYSAGTDPKASIHPLAVETAAHYGLSMEGQAPKDVEQFAGQHFDYVISLCNPAKETCPALKGTEHIDWSFTDPTEGPDDTAKEQAFIEVFRGLKRRIDLFLTVTAGRK